MAAFHPQHPLATCYYSEASNFHCAACERRVTGDGYRCRKRECAFHIHEACAKLPFQTSLDQHCLTLTEAAGSRRCYVCGQNARRYVYRCQSCDFNVHLGCVPQPQPRPQNPEPNWPQPRPRNPEPNGPRPRNPEPNWPRPRPRNPEPNWDGARRAGQIAGRIAHTGLHVLHAAHGVHGVYGLANAIGSWFTSGN
ncbi:uncharacterized protein [Triticum aestivum]|uniref:uncharacterized protein n=1 Tax=Triticum aestivum TaxID=4565 RepID=UPI0003D4B117|nr:uncharacterized protein LOC123179137 [Triticum aestivum]XP_044447519.1 uncharacterized protein LOC123179702 [Triticum aestivum]